MVLIESIAYAINIVIIIIMIQITFRKIYRRVISDIQTRRWNRRWLFAFARPIPVYARAAICVFKLSQIVLTNCIRLVAESSLRLWLALLREQALQRFFLTIKIRTRIINIFVMIYIIVVSRAVATIAIIPNYIIIIIIIAIIIYNRIRSIVVTAIVLVMLMSSY